MKYAGTSFLLEHAGTATKKQGTPPELTSSHRNLGDDEQNSGWWFIVGIPMKNGDFP